MKILIIGAGTGGLALAHLLKGAGINVAVYERDLASNADTGGYRVGISPAGSRALKACVPDELYDLYVATCARSPRYFNMLTEHFGEVLSFDIEDAGPNALDGERNVIRKTLRRVLLRGLEAEVFFGKTFQAYTNNADGSVPLVFRMEASRQVMSLWGRTARVRLCASNVCRKRASKTPGSSRSGVKFP